MRVVHAAGAPDDSGLPADRFLDREISWLQFNERVLQLAADESVPLLERARFLAIFTSNLDEFFMVRVAGLKRRIATGLAVRSASGLEPREVLEQISLVAHELQTMQSAVYKEKVQPALEDEGISIVRLGRAERRRAELPRPSTSPIRCSRCSPRWPSTRRTRSPTSPGLSLNLAVAAGQPQDRQGALRPRQGAAAAAPAAAHRARTPASPRRPTCSTRGSSRSRTSSRPTSTCCSPAWRSASTSPSGSRATRTSRSRRTTPRTSSPPWRRS